jgi:hypothetical protein
MYISREVMMDGFPVMIIERQETFIYKYRIVYLEWQEAGTYIFILHLKYSATPSSWERDTDHLPVAKVKFRNSVYVTIWGSP